jgi:hypothetical protein
MNREDRNAFHEVAEECRKNIRQWPTWKLKSSEGLWDNTTEEDRGWNILWNRVMAAARDLDLVDLTTLVSYTEKLAGIPK